MNAGKPYRACAGICLKNRDGLVFAGRRFGYTANAWQMPQGGIGEGEDPQAAAFRELYEETGVTSAGLLTRTRNWLHYDLPQELENRLWGGKYAGQKQLWFLFDFQGSDDEIDISGLGGEKAEFSDWAWMPIKEVRDQAVPFKQHIYDEVAGAFAAHLV